MFGIWVWGFPAYPGGESVLNKAEVVECGFYCFCVLRFCFVKLLFLDGTASPKSYQPLRNFTRLINKHYNKNACKNR